MRPVTFLMVEDDEGHARLNEKNVRRAGLSNEIMLFTSGRQVVDFLSSQAIAIDEKPSYLILLDLNLPEMDGYEVLAHLKDTPSTYDIPVIVLTTTDNAYEIDRCYTLGCNVYMTKPVQFDALVSAIDKIGLTLVTTQDAQGQDRKVVMG